jgi:hypothetical protein
MVMNGEISTMQPQIVEVERIVKVTDTEKMKKMEKQLEDEKIEIKQKADDERRRIEAQTGIAEEEKTRILDELKQQEEG